jgi:alanine racemase
MEINGPALQHNVAILRQQAPSSRLLAILKANAYGHGLVTIARLLQKTVDGFGVACLSEAIQLREAGITNKLVILEGALAPEEYDAALQLDLDMVIHQECQYQWLLQYVQKPSPTIWIKVNTGMNRLGFSPAEIQGLVQALHACPVILMSHLAGADQLDQPLTLQQCQVFRALIQGHTHPTLTYSLANSAGLLAWQETHYHWVRPGLALYGISPFAPSMSTRYDLRPVMTLKAKIIAIQMLQPGDAIGYYSRFLCSTHKRIGIVAFGYGDGYPYNAPAGTPVLFKKRRVPLVGQISMDMLAIDLSAQPDAIIGDEVILWGEALRLEEIAAYTNRSCYELLCGVQRSVPPRLQMTVLC